MALTVIRALVLVLVYTTLCLLYWLVESPVTKRQMALSVASRTLETKANIKDETKVKFEDRTKVKFEGGTKAKFEGGTKAKFEDGTKVKFEGGTKAKFEDGTKVKFEGGTEVKVEDKIPGNWSVFKKTSDVTWTPYMDVLTLKDALKCPIIDDPVFYVRSTVEIKDPKHIYKVGDEIILHINVKNKLKIANCSGGDNIRVRMKESKKGAYVSGYVIDHHNGSYTAVLKALWEGNPEIVVQLKYTRNEIAYLYFIRKMLLTVRTISGKFIHGKKSVLTRCYPVANRLNPQNGLCDLTDVNGGVPWFCERPKNRAYTCKHLRYIVRDEYNETAIKEAMGKYSNIWTDTVRTLGSSLKVTVKDTYGSISNMKKPFCHEYDLKSLWTQPTPVGHFYKNQWHISHCTPRWAAVDAGMEMCVRNKYFILYGDSTMVQWYGYMRDHFDCTGQPLKNAVTRELLGGNKRLNLTVRYVRHNHPGNAMAPDIDEHQRGNLESSPLESFVDNVDQSLVPVFVVHIYFHYSYYFHTIYRYRIKLLRESIAKILKKRPDAKFLIKGPHLITLKSLGTSDYFGYVYRLMLLEELSEFHDKVVYLDYMDMSHAKQVPTIHPSAAVVREMVTQMLAYVCD